MHWTDAHKWQNADTSETISAGELIKRFDRWVRIHRMSTYMCGASRGDIVRMEDNSRWIKVQN